MQGSDFVFHLAANADVRHGPDHPDRPAQAPRLICTTYLFGGGQSGAPSWPMISRASVPAPRSVR
jgi:hypothetical protein